MCGIFGFYNQRGLPKTVLEKMAEQQIHRGPDSEGFYLHGKFGIGMRRLSIIDLGGGNQPISNEDKTLWIVCNGEIYNYLELKNELKIQGHIFKTNSDVECILHLYEEYGEKCFEYLNGMFAIALYDLKNEKLIIARDRLGIKPLYYSKKPGLLLFSSEIKSIFATGLIEKEVDWQAVSKYLNKMYISTPKSPFKNIEKLEAGYYLTLKANGDFRKKCFWELQEKNITDFTGSFDESLENLIHILKDSSRLRLRADVPVCAFLSGGIDSSAVVAFAAMESSSPLKTYHVYFEGGDKYKMDERQYAKSVSERYGTRHTEVIVTRNDFKALIPKMIFHLEEPFADLASIPTYIISNMASEDVTVCLNGSGGDELFGGYAHHSHKALLKNKLAEMLDRHKSGSEIRKFLKKTNNALQWSKLFPNYRNSKFKDFGFFDLLNCKHDIVNRVMAEDIKGYLQSNILFLLDKITMSVSMEGRVPLLDHRFVEFASMIPSRWKIKDGEKKFIFKKAMETYLPKEVIYRKKEGFGAPLFSWIDSETMEIFKKIILSGNLRKNGYLVIEEKQISNFHIWDLWKIVCLELWYKIFFENACSDIYKNMNLKDFV